ncbi:MAG: protein-L-isoaspartate(D-aspartate) O-methyltransferase [Planctomycetes bacterium]|nr:protein-L-isoaspartate(D-aspartate) O-methyltransferase [Planctomycetota bacterium]
MPNLVSPRIDYSTLRRRMVEKQIAARGVRSPLVLAAMGKVAREGYMPSYLGEFAYEDTPLPIEEEQTISQPYIVAFMIDALELRGGERVLEVGTGSGYAAAVLAEIAGEVYTIERHRSLAREAERRLARDGYRHVHVRHGDGTLGWPEAAPFDAIVVAAGGPKVPGSLREQLAVGGRLVIPVGDVVGLQKLVRVTRASATRWTEEDLGGVRFVPLVGNQGWQEAPPAATPPAARALSEHVALACEPFASIDTADLEPLMRRIGDARVVLLGEATHGSSEFYRMRARITRELIQRQGFDLVAVEADWPDAARIDHYVRDRDVPRGKWSAFARFPAWMWRNRDVRDFVDWLHDHNRRREPARRVRFAGLDLYGLYNSIAAVLAYLDRVDPASAAVARQRYGCLTPWQSEPAEYGRAALTGRYRSCESDVVNVLRELLARDMDALRSTDEALFEALQNARVVADAESYYRVMYQGAAESWNLRDRHMFQSLRALLDFHGPRSKAVVWAHNSHVGDAAATEMAARGEENIGQMCRQRFGPGAYVVGFGTDHGTVAAASHWGGAMEVKNVRPSHAQSYERVCHESGEPAFFLPLRAPLDPDVRRALTEPRLVRMIGVIYRPETELASHYLHAVLPHQFDEFVWFDRTEAVQPIETQELSGMPDTYPFGL